MDEDRTLYEERTPWAWWVRAVLWGAVAGACYPVLAGWETDLALLGRFMIAAGFLAFAGGIEALLGGLTVQVREAGLFMHLGRCRWFVEAFPSRTSSPWSRSGTGPSGTTEDGV